MGDVVSERRLPSRVETVVDAGGLCLVRVRFDDRHHLHELAAPWPLDTVFAPAERAEVVGRGLERAAGRLAAKVAVLGAAGAWGDRLADVRVERRRSAAPAPTGAHAGLLLSVSHDRGIAVAACGAAGPAGPAGVLAGVAQVCDARA